MKKFEELFTESLNNNPKLSVLSKLANADYEEHDAHSFHKSAYSGKHNLMLSQHTPEELDKMHLFKVKGHNVGFALKDREDGGKELSLVHNNEKGVKGIGDHIVRAAIKAGATHADYYDGKLDSLYKKNGFAEYHRDKFDPQYDKGGKFEAKYGRPDIVYVRRTEPVSESFRDLVEK